MMRFSFFICVVVIMSCNGGCNSGSSGSSTISGANITHENFVPPAPREVIGRNVDIDAIIEKRGGRIIQYTCALLSPQIIADALGKTTQELSMTNATPPAESPQQSACFIKYEDFDLPNAGLFVQMIRNPFPDEYPDYISKYVESYRLQGEQAVDEAPIFFKKFEGFGDDGSYSTEAGKYYWRLGERVSFLIAFNTLHNPAEQYEIATKLAKALTEAYIR